VRGDAYFQRADFDAGAYSFSLLDCAQGLIILPPGLNACARMYILAPSCPMVAPARPLLVTGWDQGDPY